MKYLKKYCENLIKSNSDKYLEEADKFRKITHEYLAYLKDNFQVRVDSGGMRCVSKSVDVSIANITKNDINKKVNIFYWNDIKDDVIPFILYMSNKYKFKCMRFKMDYEGFHDRGISINLDDILNDEIDNIIKSYKNRIKQSNGGLKHVSIIFTDIQ